MNKFYAVLLTCIFSLATAQAQSGEQYIEQQTAEAKAGNYWAKYNLWDSYARGKHGVAKNQAEADKWLAEVVNGVYVAKFEPANGFNPRTPKEILDNFGKYCGLRSGKNSIGGASFFRTTKQGEKLVGSFLTVYPDQFKAALQKNSSLKLISVEKITPEAFVAYERSKQESL